LKSFRQLDFSQLTWPAVKKNVGIKMSKIRIKGVLPAQNIKKTRKTTFFIENFNKTKILKQV